MVASYLDRGKPIVLFVHGLGCSMDYWKCIWASDQLAGYSLLAVDLIGFGRSDKPQKFDYRLEQQADALLSLISDLGAPVSIVGHSMGGAIATLLLSREEVAAFVNVEGNLTSADGGLVSRKTAAQDETKFVEHGFSQLHRRFPDWPEGYVSIGSCTPTAFYRSACSLVSWTDSGLLLEKFQQFPDAKCYMHGDQSANFDTINSLGGIQTICIPDSGHFPMVDNPDSFCQAIASFLATSK